MQLSGAAALVTGAGSGLGAATAEALAAAGARVVAMDLNAEGLAALASRCGATPIAGDVAKEAMSRPRWKPRPASARCGWR